MAFVYESINTSGTRVNGVNTTFVQTKDPIKFMDGLVEQKKFVRRDVLDSECIVGETIPKHSEVYINTTTGKVMMATNPTQVGVGSLANDGKANVKNSFVNYPYSVNIAGNTALTASGDLVIGAGGRLTNSLGVAISIASSVVGAATGDFDNSVWNGVKLPVIETLADDTTARGLIVTLYALDVNGDFYTEALILNATDSSIDVKGTKAPSKVLAIGLSGAITTTTLRLKNDLEAICKEIATPASFTAPDTGTLYGAVVTDDSNDPAGHSVLITLSSALAVGKHIAVLGSDDNDNIQYEVIEGTGATTVRTTKQFKSFYRILIGDDDIATATVSASATVNTSGQKVGTAPAGGVAANATFLCKRA